MSDNSISYPKTKAKDSNVFDNMSRFILLGFVVSLGDSVINRDMPILIAIVLAVLMSFTFLCISRALNKGSEN